MNWRVSALDGRTLVSNSDAHSPSKLGREANLFDCDLSFYDIRSTLETGDPRRFLGTLEFYPEEGKYHLDGHRKCGICFHPQKSVAARGICPVCQQPLTLGVLYRVEALADRPEGEKPPGAHPFSSVVPLVDILADIYRVGPGSKKVSHAYEKVLKSLGSELSILTEIDIASLDRAGIPLLAEAIHRMRFGQIHVNGGFDGQFGTVEIFTTDERDRLIGQKSLFIIPKKSENSVAPEPPEESSSDIPRVATPPKVAFKDLSPSGLNPEQRRAVTHGSGPVMIVAGPGTGKTLTLTRRIAHMVMHRGVLPERILAVTFTNKAAKEMTARLGRLMPGPGIRPLIKTFHGLCLCLLKEEGVVTGASIIDDADRKALVGDAMELVLERGDPAGGSLQTNLDRILQAKQRLLTAQDDLGEITPDAEKNGFKKVYGIYESLLTQQGLLDFEDLIIKVVRRLESNPKFLASCIQRFRHIFIDEYQDLNYGQYRLIRILASKGNDLFVIGDPDQAIYGFRGSDRRYFTQFMADYPGAAVIRLTRNYRSVETILQAAYQVIRPQHSDGIDTRTGSLSAGGKRVTVLEAGTETGEAVVIGKAIETMVGGLGMHAMDFGKAGKTGGDDRFGFSDFAVLARTRNQLDVVAEQFESAGIPFQLAARDNLFGKKGIAEIISLLKVVVGNGSFTDLERIRGLVRPGISRDSARCFKWWCIKNRISVDRARFKVREFPVPGLTQKRQQRLYDFLGTLFTLGQAVGSIPVAEKIRYLLKNSKVTELFSEKSGQALDRLMEMASEAGHDTAGFIADIALCKDSDTLMPGVEKVSLMTMHAAKGLEFTVVFVSGCEAGIIPFSRSGKKIVDEEEERRLFYVALTRAEKELYLTRARNRTVHGRRQSQTGSPFLADMENLLKQEEAWAPKPDPGQVQMKLF
ncbi:MAG: UvrD-helicase domain-containing protein [Desulfobacterales bacterium]|nr:UvrD-helicase domain-containing protein [Desulfobacterales bacterium]